MKISKIEFENFRNFKEKCCITFPTDGSVTVIYGPNGVGKTTLHQLFQWIFYGEVHFNKTASKEMFNLDFEQEAAVNKAFSVWGIIDFEHPNSAGEIEKYSIRILDWRMNVVVPSRRAAVTHLERPVESIKNRLEERGILTCSRQILKICLEIDSLLDWNLLHGQRLQ